MPKPKHNNNAESERSRFSASPAASPLHNTLEDKKKTGISQILPPLEDLRATDLKANERDLNFGIEPLCRLQAELDALKQRYLDLYEQAPVGYFILNDMGIIQESNFTAAAMLQTTKEALIGQPVTRFILQEDHGAYHHHLVDLLKEGARGAVEFRMLRSDEESFWARMEVCTSKNAANRLYSRAVLSDITPQKQADKAKHDFDTHQLQLQKSESLARMAGAIAHHFNNQLQTVMLSLELTLESLSQGKTPTDMLAEAIAAVRRAAEVSSMMLAYLGQVHGKQEPLDLSDVCRQRLPELKKTTLDRVPVEAHLPSPGPAITANANEIQQVLTNLLTNAREAVGNALSPIDLSVKTVDPGEIPAEHRFPIGWEPHETAYACLEVADKGCGITRKDLENLFDPFFSSKFAGRGLGLAVVLGIVRSHKGAVTVQSEPGRGSVFRVYFPMTAVPMPRRQKEQSLTTLPMNRYGTVLLVDDDASLRELAATVIRDLGFDVLEAQDGADAVQVYRAHIDEIQLVVCDLTMPRMDGWATLAALREISPSLPIILSSGYDETKAMAGDHPEQPHAFLKKPYVIKELSELIFRILKDQGISMEENARLHSQRRNVSQAPRN
jgi:PAS domain S-box-containing protein